MALVSEALEEFLLPALFNSIKPHILLAAGCDPPCWRWEIASVRRSMAGRCIFRSEPRIQLQEFPNGVPASEMTVWRAVVRVLRSPLDSLSCIAFPSPCRLCDEPLLTLSNTPVCTPCWRSLHPQSTNNLCTICGEHLGWGDLRFSSNGSEHTRSLCDLCERARPNFVQAVAYGVYEGHLRSMIHLLKYEQVGVAAVPLGKLLAESIHLLRDLPEQLTVATVPLHGTKQRERGFNQTVLLADAAVRQLRRTHPRSSFELAPHSLARQRRTGSQAGLTPHQRRLNLRGAFHVPQPEHIAGRSILLIDDIYTTGATARECTKTLLASGARAVYVATLARSQREGVALWNRMNTRTAASNMSPVTSGVS